MPLTWVLDVILVLVLLGYLVYGYQSGLVRSVSALVGIVVGGIAAVFVIPLVGSWVPEPEWRGPATLLAAALLLIGGFAAGASVGRAIRRQVDRTPLRVVDRLLGAVINVVVAALVTSMVAFGIGSMGVPLLSQAIASSAVLRTIDNVSPEPVKAFLAQVRSVVLQNGIPHIVDAFNGPAPTVPQVDTGTADLASAARSVVRITGNAYACGQNQSGTGFVIAPGRIITNAHVVAGVTEPVVETSEDGAKVGEIVYFDPVDDLAVIAVGGLTTPSLRFTSNLEPDSTAVVDGYPFGGPFSSHPARVVSVETMLMADIYGQNPAPREVYTLAANVQQGESGGPLLTEDGAVAGVIFAKGAETPNVGYALAMEEVSPVVAQVEALDSPVSSGTCIRE